MNMRKLLYPIGVPVLLLFSFVGLAQDKLITGRVTDSTGNGIANVSVTVKEVPARGTTTATDGRFSLSVPANASTLVFSSVGYAYREVPISGTAVNVSLQATASDLNTVVVIGYGTTRKKDLTGAVATVSAKDFQKGVITTPEQLIAGKVAGVSIISNGGQPGSGSTIRVRGGSSLNASNDPLIVIDGVPLDNGGIRGGNSPLSFINANDIESFTVLKDASAAAIYGTRASNGVIIITTKKGRSGKARFNFTTTNSVSEVTDRVDVLNGDQVRDIVNNLGTAAQKAQLGTANTDWQNQIYQTARSSDNNLSITGGIGSVPFRVSLGYLNQTGILKTDRLEKTSAAIVLNPVLFDNHLKIDINLKGSNQRYRFANTGAIGTAVYFDPTQPVKSKSNKYFDWSNADGTPNTNASRNPLAMLYDWHDNSDAYRSIGNIQFDYKLHFLPDLHANLNLGYDVSKGTTRRFVSDSSTLEFTSGGERNHGKQTKQNTLLEFYLNYAKDLKSIRSRVDAIAGYSYNNYQTTNYNYASFNAKGIKVPGSDPAFPFDKPENTLLSYFGRVNYTFNEKYLLTATIRRDGSSRFSPKNRWGLFPSAALAWKLKDDLFRNSRAVSDLKLRLGYGVTGQQEGIGNYDYLVYYNLSNPSASYQFGNTFYRMFKPGGFYANRKWEETTTYNAALDYGFLDNRINGSVDVYLKKTKDLLNSIPVPAGTNFAAFILANVGSMENKGVEFIINGQPVRNKLVTWDVSFNATYNKNTITNLTVVADNPYYIGFPSQTVSGAQGFAFINSVGTGKNTFYLYRQIYDESGKPIEGLVEDANRDGIINESDKYKGKRADPNLFMGFSTNLSYKKWNAGFVTRANFNNYVYNNIYSNNGRLNQILGSYTTGNASANYLETEFTGNAVNRNAQVLSDYYLQNASFLKMDNIYVGYNFGRVIQNKASLRLNLNVQNVFTVTKYTGLDPEISWGVDNNLYPRPRIYSIAANLDF
jgi:iron complex outermembrane receptor protein